MENSAFWGILSIQTAMCLAMLVNSFQLKSAVLSVKDQCKVVVKLVSNLREDNMEHMKDHTRIIEKMNALDEDIRELRQR